MFLSKEDVQVSAQPILYEDTQKNILTSVYTVTSIVT